LGSYSKFFDVVRVTFWTRCREIILAFADVAKSYGFSAGNLVVADADGAFFALRDVAAFVADKAVGVSFFVDYDSN